VPDAPLKAARGPFNGGYTSAVEPFFARPEQLVGDTAGSDTNSSRDTLIDPFTGGVSKRAGCAIQNDTESSGVTVNGLLDAHWNAKSRKFFALDSPSMDDNYPVPAILFSEDTNAGFPSVDSGFPGTVFVASSNSGGLTDAQKRYQLLSEFSSTHYPGNVSGAYNSTGTDSWPYKVVPIWIESGDGVYNRGALTGTAGTDKFMQQYTACGSRALLQTERWLYAPNLRCTPWRWNKRLNESTSVAGEVIRVYPTGPLPPLYPPFYNASGGDLPTPANGSPWVEGDTFYLSVLFQFEDGSYSAPFIPRAINPVLTSGHGLVTVGSISATPTNKYPYITYRNVPIGPEGTVARILCRTLKQNRTDATDTITVSPLDLRVIGVLKNNTQTTFLDYGGDDDSLLEDDDVIRVDLQMPRRARYIGTGDQRAIIGYTLPNTAAIILAMVNVNGGGANVFDASFADDDVTRGNNQYNSNAALVRITDTDLELHYNAGSGTAPVYDTAPTYTGTANGTAVKFPIATYTTLGAMVDAINKTLYTTANCQDWAAQLAPGIDDTMPSAALTRTTFTISVTGTSSVTLTGAAADVLRVGVGMRVNGTNVTDGTYVVSKTATTITLSTATTGAPANVFFSSNTGDQTAIANSTWGYMRSFGANQPILLHVKASSLPGYATPDKAAVYFTGSSPGANSSGTSLAANNWLAGNRRLPPSSSRATMKRNLTGIVDMEGTALIAYSDGIYMLRNVRGANTGEDEDYRHFTINESRGCISYLGLASGNGWAVYPTTEGIVVTDKTGREFSISGDVYNPSDMKGDLAYELMTSAASAASDSDDQQLSIAVMGSKIAVSFRTQQTPVAKTLFYDFSPGIEASGVEELIEPQNKRPYIWSPPAGFNGVQQQGYPIGAMGSIQSSTGRSDYVCFDATDGATGDGRFDKILTGTTDNGDSFFGYAVAAPWIANDFMSLSPQECEVKHLTIAGTESSLYFANDQTPTFNTNSGFARSLPVVAGKTRFQKQIVPIAVGQRGKTDLFWAEWRASATASTSTRLYQIVLHYDEVESTVKYTGA